MQLNDGYKDWLYELKARIQSSQIKAALAVNAQLIMLYWDLGRQITEKQQTAKWGSGLINQLALDLKIAFPEISGFSKSNLFNIRQFYQYYTDNQLVFEQLGKETTIVQQLAGFFTGYVHQAGGLISNKENVQQPVGVLDRHDQIVQQAVGFLDNANKAPAIIRDYCLQIPWGHNMVVLQKCKTPQEVFFYLKETIANNWSRSILQMQIESRLHERQGKAISNFEYTLPKPQSDLARQLLKDPYNFDFLTLEKEVQELELERKLVQNITQFLLELGKGFAYMGRQYELKVGTKEYRLDLLFYHVKLKCYVVIELKTVAFEPEFVGKLNFYLSAIDSLVKEANDNTTIGILLCKTKDNLNVEFALKDINKPIGVSEYTFSELPLEIQREIPTVEEFEKGLMDIH